MRPSGLGVLGRLMSDVVSFKREDAPMAYQFPPDVENRVKQHMASGSYATNPNYS